MSSTGSSKKHFETFSEKIEQRLRLEDMGLPDRSMASYFRNANHEYEPIRTSWRQVREALEYERSLLKRLEDAPNMAAELGMISDEIYENDRRPLRELDIGVASAVLTLSALGCVTLSSCNGGCFGDFHHERHPLVVFYAKPEHAPLLMKAARESGVGIGHDEGYLMVWANDIWNMHHFAEQIVKVHKFSHKRRIDPNIKG